MPGQASAATAALAAFILTSYIQHLTTEEGDLNAISAELAVAVIVPLMSLRDQLDSVLQEEGWKKEDIAPQVSELSKEMISAANGAEPGIAPLTLAFAVDNYAKLLIKGTMTT
jgi:L-fucose mutarotase/ribose pyranase (RbsD/FucU family)